MHTTIADNATIGPVTVALSMTSIWAALSCLDSAKYPILRTLIKMLDEKGLFSL